MKELIDKWAEILHLEDLTEVKTGRISSYFQELKQYRTFLKDCEQHNYSADQAEDIWYMANQRANELYDIDC